MTYLILARDDTDAEAPDRRLAARDAHVAFITEEAKAGRLVLGLPVQDEAARSLGSMMILDVPDQTGVDAYLAAEPFARQDVWVRIGTHPFRIAPLPYAPWPTPGSAMPGPRSHTILVALDGQDDGAAQRRQAARPAHMERIRPHAAEGTLLLGGAILAAPGGPMIGSVAVTRHMDHDAAQRFWEEDPYMRAGVWQEMTFHATLLRPLPYKALPSG